MGASTPAFGSFHQTNSAGMNYICRSTLSQHNEEKMASISIKGIASHWNLLPALLVASSTFKEKKSSLQFVPQVSAYGFTNTMRGNIHSRLLNIVVLSRADLFSLCASWRSSAAIAKGKQCSAMKRLITALFSLTRS